MNWLLAIFLSFSMRSANIQPNVYDYEYKAGIDTSRVYCAGLTERESGNYYKGLDLQIKPIKINKVVHNISGGTLIKEAQEISTQEIRLSRGDIFNYSIVNNWEKWSEYRTLIGVGIDLGSFKINYDTNFNKRKVFSVYAGKDFPIGKKGFYINNFIIYNNHSDKEYWQAKTQIGWKR